MRPSSRSIARCWVRANDWPPAVSLARAWAAIVGSRPGRKPSRQCRRRSTSGGRSRESSPRRDRRRIAAGAGGGRNGCRGADLRPSRDHPLGREGGVLGKSVAVGVDLGGRGLIKKKKTNDK